MGIICIWFMPAKNKGKAEKFELDKAIKRVKELEKELDKRFI